MKIIIQAALVAATVGSVNPAVAEAGDVLSNAPPANPVSDPWRPESEAVAGSYGMLPVFRKPSTRPDGSVAADHGGYYARLNGLVPMARGHRSNAADAVRPRFREARGRIQGKVTAPPAERAVLPIVLVTDIEDDAFLARFRQVIENGFAGPASARDLGIRVAVEFRRIAPRELYPDGGPGRGVSIDLDDHLRRFPEGELFLTTGGTASYARPGHGFVLGRAPLGESLVVHEFARLIGLAHGDGGASRQSTELPLNAERVW